MAGGGLLGAFEQYVLLAVLHLGAEAYGVRISDEITRRSGRDVSRGSLYVTFDRLEAKGLIVSEYGDGSDKRGGRRRRYVSLTPTGVEALRGAREELMRLWEGLEGVLGERT
jgi:DNA-binding PadR family transcriptional regulator